MKMAVAGLGNFPSSPTAATLSRHKNYEIVHFRPIFTLSWLVCARACAYARGYIGNFIDFLRYSHPSKVQKHENSSSGEYRFHHGLLYVLPRHPFHGSILIPSPRI